MTGLDDDGAAVPASIQRSPPSDAVVRSAADDDHQPISAEDARALIQAIASLAQMADRALPARVDPLTARLANHLGPIDGTVANTSTTFGLFERVNLQLAMNAYSDEVAAFELVGLPADIGQ